MRREGAIAGLGRRWLAALAALALMLQIAVPPGLMVSARKGAPALVICTGHGPLMGLDPHQAPAKAPRPGGGPCAFAGHGLAAPPPPIAVLAGGVLAWVVAPAEARRFDLAPGRGLAAPPPPPQGPPPLGL